MKRIMIILMMVLLISQISAGTIKVYPSDDSFVRENFDATNYGDSIDLRVGKDKPEYGKERSFLKFDLSELDLQEVNSVSFSIDTTPITAGESPLVNLYKSENDWNEGFITWNSQPGYSSLLDSHFVNSADRIYFDFDVSELEEDFSVVLIESGEDEFVNFFSKEHVSEFRRPYLEIDYEGACEAGDLNCDGCFTLIEYNDFKYGFKNGFYPEVELTTYNDIKYGFKNGLITC